MTSSQEPPLTRREIRERERLIEQQQAASATQQTDGTAPAQPPQAAPPAYPPPPQYPQQQRVPQPTGPQGGGYGAPARGAPAGPPQQRPGEPRPAPQAPGRPPQAWSDAPTRGQQGGPQQYPQSAPPPRDPYTSGAMPVPQGDPRGQGQQRPPQGEAPRPPQGPPRSAPAPRTTPERTLTRRELRAMLDSHAGDGFADDEFDEVPQRPAPSAQRGPGPQQRPPQGGPDGRGPAPQPPSRHPHQPAPGRAAAPHTTVDAGLDEPVAAPKPVGHWTSQLNLPDERVEPYDQLLSRGGSPSGVPTTTNALILPTLPDQGALAGTPLAPSGEIIVTGSIDLPRSYGSTGVHPSQIDSSDVDRIFDSNVEDVAGPGVAPVAATRAISTQGPSKAMMAPPSKEGMNVPLVLAVTAGVLALGVVATLVVGAVAGLF